MTLETIFQAEILTNFIYPFLLIFFILFAILEKTKTLGENKQINAVVSFVVGLIFVGAIFPKFVVGNLMLFLSLAIVILFVIFVIWGFISGKEISSIGGGWKNFLFVVLIIAIVIFLLSLFGVLTPIWNSVKSLFTQSWSASLWENVIFVLVIAGALAIVWKSKSGS